MLVNNLIKFRKIPILKKFMHRVLLNKGLELPNSVKIGKNVKFPHNAIGTVIHNNCLINDNVKIYQNVTIGRADVYIKAKYSKFEKNILDNGCVICSGAKVLCKKGTLIVGKNTIIAANAVLTQSTGDNEIWAGIPAKKIRNLTKDELNEKDINN